MCGLDGLARGAWVRGTALLFCALACTGCPSLPELEQSRSDRGTLGEEVYGLLCRRLAGTELPADVDGSESSAICRGDQQTVETVVEAGEGMLPARLLSLAERRKGLVGAVDTTLPVTTDADGNRRRLANELEEFLRELVGFYEKPDERIQRASRSVAAATEALLADTSGRPRAGVLRGLARLGQSGTVPPEHSLSVLRAVFASPRLGGLLADVLSLLGRDGALDEALQTLLTGVALELAGSEFDDDPASDARVSRDLLLRTHPDFASDGPLWVAERDARGLPAVRLGPDGKVPSPFVDADGDGQADTLGGVLSTRAADDGSTVPVPTPFAHAGSPDIERDAQGRATRDGSLLFRYVDADRTAMHGLLSEAGALFDPETHIAISLAKAAPQVFGKRVPTSFVEGEARLDGYMAPDTDESPLIDLVHASSVLGDRPVFPATLELTELLFEEHESEIAGMLKALVGFERAVRPGDPRYPDAGMPEDTTFWDDLFFELEKVSRRRQRGDGTSLLEGLLRGARGEYPDGSIEARQRYQGVLLSVMLRYKDEWRGDPRDPQAPALGGFRERVDRTLPDLPVTCGRDGCAGTLADSERYDFDGFLTARNQQCVIPRPGQIGSDCGAPSNQSLMQRSINLIVEMDGRGVCNRGISIEDMLAFAVPVCDGEADRLPPFGQPDGDLYDPPGGDDPCAVLGLPVGSSECDAIRELERQQCRQLKADREGEQAQLVEDSRKALLEPAALAKYVRPFESGSDPVVEQPDGELFPVRDCELFDFADVGRVFGQALAGDFELNIPHPGLRRYLEDVARVVRGDLPICEDLAIDWENPPTPEPDCIPNAAAVSRDVFGDIDDGVDTLDELIEYLSKVEGMTTRPSAQAMTRVLFAASGSSALQVFDPLLVKGAPPACVGDDGNDLRDAGAPECGRDDSQPEPAGCCIADRLAPPLRYRVDTYYGNTAFAWDVPFEVRDPKTGQTETVTFNDTLETFAAWVNAHDFDPVADADRVDEFEDTGYLLASLGAAVGVHWDSADNPLAQDSDPDAPFYRPLSGFVTWEEMLADVLDDGSIVRARLDVLGDVEDDPSTPDDERFVEGPLPELGPERQLGLVSRAFDLLGVAAGLDLGEAGDGLQVMAELTEYLFNPHAFCAPDPTTRGVVAGRGACHITDGESVVPTLQPIAYRDGRKYVCHNDGTCFDDPDAFRYVSPIYLMVDALHDLEDRIEVDDRANEAFQTARNGLVDTFLNVEDGRLSDRKLRALLVTFARFMRDWQAYHAEAGDLQEWARSLTEDTVDMVSHPAFAGALAMLEEVIDEPAALDSLEGFAYELFSGSQAQGRRALLAGLMDVTQQTPGSVDTTELLRALSEAFAQGAELAVLRGGDVDPEAAAMYRNLRLAGDAVARDEQGVLAEVLGNLVRPIGGDTTLGPGATPLDAFMEALLEVNRLTPGERSVLTGADWAQVLREVVDLLRDDRRGLERLFELVKCREATPDDAECNPE